MRLVGERLCPVASPAYLEEAKAPLEKPADLRRHVMLALHDPQGRWPWLSWAAWLEANGDRRPRARAARSPTTSTTR